MYYLKDGDDPHADRVLLPSIAYLLLDHRPRYGYGKDNFKGEQEGDEQEGGEQEGGEQLLQFLPF